MKFSDGFWLHRPGWDVLTGREIQSMERDGDSLIVYVSTKHLPHRGAELDSTQLTVTLTAWSEGIIRVRIEHFRGGLDQTPFFRIAKPELSDEGAIQIKDGHATVSAGMLRAQVSDDKGGYQLEFFNGDKRLTSSPHRAEGIAVSPEGTKYLYEQLLVQPNECIYGLGERFGPVVKNGQVVDLWNADGGTASEQAYKNIPFYLTNKGYGIFVNHPEKVSYEVCSEVNTRVQFSVKGEVLEYFVIQGDTPANILDSYTNLTGKAPRVPDWSYGLWLSTSFTTDYSEETVHSFIDKMEELHIPLSVFHFDCYWMRPSRWCDFVWHPEMFHDPTGMVKRLHDRGIKVCVWINPYIGQQSHLFDEGKKEGYLLKRPDGSVRQWDHWQPGMAWVDFTNPEARRWWKDKLRELLRQGVDCFKTDFGERVPTDVQWHDNSDPERMHNYYSFLYNECVFEVLQEERGIEESLVFARSATAGSQVFPVHWGGDSEPTFGSMAETLRGGLSFGLSGFAYWSHDMGGFEGHSSDAVFKRWFPFGMLSSHSRLHGSASYRVPWIYGDDAVECARRFVRLKNRLIPYLKKAEDAAVGHGIPILRHMILEFPHDLGCSHVDTQYMLGPSLLVAPVFSEEGDVDFYLPTDRWINILDGHVVEGKGWHHEVHDFQSLPLMVESGTVLPLSNNAQTTTGTLPEGLTLAIFGSRVSSQEIMIGTGSDETCIQIDRKGSTVTIKKASGIKDWSVSIVAAQYECNEGEEAGKHGIKEIAESRVIYPDKNSEMISITFSDGENELPS
ncbi:MAG: alpha-xylosidase [Actinomycetaceae bacterium]|nr:alpha-xylosidase [Actinomycetaceae bacterium]